MSGWATQLRGTRHNVWKRTMEDRYRSFSLFNQWSSEYLFLGFPHCPKKWAWVSLHAKVLKRPCAKNPPLENDEGDSCLFLLSWDGAKQDRRLGGRTDGDCFWDWRREKMKVAKSAIKGTLFFHTLHAMQNTSTVALLCYTPPPPLHEIEDSRR